jgi:hypothetical protein
MQIGLARRCLGLLLDALQRRHQYRQQQCDNGNHH